VTRVSRGTGADDINAGLHHRFIRRPNSGSRFHESLIAGEPVVIRVNDYGRGLFNGDQGIVLYVVDRNSDETRPTAVFRRPDGFACFHLDVLRPVLVHGYAMTVHKAQGSEFNTIGLILPDHDLPINSREVLYTALTRSRQGVAIVGSRQIFEAGIERTIARDSGMVDKLCERR
jgi:exodeoxyribonuclease V alpha subunit